MPTPARRLQRLARTFALAAVAAAIAASDVALTIDAGTAGAPLDLGRYGFGQGGLAASAMLHPHVARIAELKPRTIRVFLQEYYGLYPAHGVFHWDTLDATLRDVVAAGARPIANICFKPSVLYPLIDQDIVAPTSWDEWESLIVALVAHCRDQGFAVALWEIGNEGDIGESGGCPYRFTPENYVTYYAHTAAAIRRVDPAAKVGGPALAGLGPIGDALIAAAGAGLVPLDVFSWHGYTSDPASLASGASSVTAQLRRYPALAATETMISEWNMDLGAPSADPAFQPAFALEATRLFAANGLSRAAHYHLCDVHVDRAEFAPFMSPGGASAMADWWNVHPQYDGLFGFAGDERPTWRAFRWLADLDGAGVPVVGEGGGVHAFAATGGDALHAVIWSFGAAAGTRASLALPASRDGFYRLSRLDSAAVAVQAIASGPASALATPLALTFAPYDVYALDVGPVELDPAVLAFTAVQGGAPPAAQDVVVHDVGADHALPFTVTSDAAWLRVATAGAGDGQVLHGAVDPTGLPTGTSVAEIHVARGALTLTCEASLRVVAAPPDGDTLHRDETPTIAGTSDGVPYELGAKFTADVAGEIRAIRFWSPPGDAGVHTGRIWTVAGAVLATTSFPDDGSVGWRSAPLDAPLAIVAGALYVVTVDTAGPYVATNDGLALRIGAGAVHSVADGANGVFGARGAFPTSTWRSTDYFRDVVFHATGGSIASATTHGAQQPAIGDIADGVGYELGAKFAANVPGRVTAIRFWQPPSDQDAHTGRIWSSAGAVLATTAFAAGGAAGWRSAPLPTALALTPGTTYVVTVDTAGPYVATNHGLAQPLGDGPVRTIADGADGVYGPRGAFPTSSYLDTDYFRDVEFTPDAAAATIEPSGDG